MTVRDLVFSSALSLVFPELCPSCGQLGDGGKGLCADCEDKIPNRLLPFEPPDFIRSAWALGSYNGPLGELVRLGKYGNRPHIFETLGNRLVCAAKGRLPPVDLICPVPTGWTRRLRRGFDQTALLVRPLAEVLGLRQIRLSRRVASLAQAGRSRNERMRSIHKVYQSPPIGGNRVLLVDDICTTGATAEGCAMALMLAGAARIDFLCVARTKIDFGDG